MQIPFTFFGNYIPDQPFSGIEIIGDLVRFKVGSTLSKIWDTGFFAGTVTDKLCIQNIPFEVDSDEAGLQLQVFVFDISVTPEVGFFLIDTECGGVAC